MGGDADSNRHAWCGCGDAGGDGDSHKLRRNVLEGARALALKLKPVYAPFVYMCMHMHMLHVPAYRPTGDRLRSQFVCVRCAHWSITGRFTGPVTGNVPVNGLLRATIKKK